MAKNKQSDTFIPSNTKRYLPLNNRSFTFIICALTVYVVNYLDTTLLRLRLIRFNLFVLIAQGKLLPTLTSLLVDFRCAFDSMKHNILGKLLYSIGLSSMFILVLPSLYSQAKMKIIINRRAETDISIYWRGSTGGSPESIIVNPVDVRCGGVF